MAWLGKRHITWTAGSDCSSVGVGCDYDGGGCRSRQSGWFLATTDRYSGVCEGLMVELYKGKMGFSEFANFILFFV